MEEKKGSKTKNTKLLTILISVLAGAGVILITLSLLFGFGILGNKKIASSSGESEVEEAAEVNNESLDIVSMTVDEAYEAYNSGEDYIFLDVRSEDEYNSGHIEGAVFITISELKGRLDELTKDKPIIAYCNGSTCGRSERAAEILLENGFGEVYNMAGRGIDEWIEKGYPSEQTEEETATAEVTLISVEEVYGIIVNGEDYFILDVRNQDEYDEAHIEDVSLIPVDTLESRLNELPTDKPIIVYCKAGGRSATASALLVENGFTQVYDMGGGITEWIEKGYPTVSEK
ncbi:MAG: rhodanese-like domain-containing protein [Actinomycetota bacterium]